MGSINILHNVWEISRARKYVQITFTHVYRHELLTLGQMALHFPNMLPYAFMSW